MTDDVRPPVDPVRASIGANVRAELARRGIPQIEISRIIGISQRQVSERILGRVGFEARELLLIAKELGVSVEQLASLDDLAAIERAEAGAA